MKINFKLDERKISKSSRSKIYDLGTIITTVQELLDNSEITITDNFIPIIKITAIDDSISYYLLPDLNYEWANISNRNIFAFTIDDLIALGGSGSSGDPRPYKVYSALLSQSGTDDPQTATSGTLTQGVTYEILDFVAGDNFIPSGAPNNNVGTKWIANGVSPTWSNGSEIGWNGGAPTPQKFLNTIGNVWYTYNDSGSYLLLSDGLFLENRTFISPKRGFSKIDAGEIDAFFSLRWIDESTISIQCADNTNDYIDDLLFSVPLTIEII